MNPADILWTPSREQVLTTNAWAFLHWLDTARGTALADWPALHAFSAVDPIGFRAALADFCHLPEAPSRIVRHTGDAEALVLFGTDGSRRAFSHDDLAAPRTDLPADIATALTRLWPRATLARALADILLYQDIRPDDSVLVAGNPSWPSLAALLQGSRIILHAGRQDTLLPAAADEQATIILAPANWLADGSFQRSRRPDLRKLRAIVATGGPLAPEARLRVATWIKPNLMLLARAGETVWGNPLVPVRTRPEAGPALFAPVRQPVPDPDQP
jgi:hypothetical protein